MNYRTTRTKKEQTQIPQSQILFFERRDQKNTVTSLVIGPTGEMPSDQPASSRDFFVKEVMDLLES
jgi:hypothetical protein